MAKVPLGWGAPLCLGASFFERDEIAQVGELTDPKRPHPLDGPVKNLGAILDGEEAEVVAVECDDLRVGGLLEGDGPVGAPHET